MLRLTVASLALASLVVLVLPAVDAVAVQPPALPCQTGIAGTDCAVGAFSCAAHAGYRTGSGSYDYAYVYCGPPTFAPCTVAYVDTNGNVASCLVA